MVLWTFTLLPASAPAITENITKSLGPLPASAVDILTTFG